MDAQNTKCNYRQIEPIPFNDTSDQDLDFDNEIIQSILSDFSTLSPEGPVFDNTTFPPKVDLSLAGSIENSSFEITELEKGCSFNNAHQTIVTCDSYSSDNSWETSLSDQNSTFQILEQGNDSSFEKKHQAITPIEIHFDTYASDYSRETSISDQKSVSSCSADSQASDFDDSLAPTSVSSITSSQPYVVLPSDHPKSRFVSKSFEENWRHHYQQILAFVREHGHANVPHTYPKNPKLARWVKRQRHQHKLLKDGKQSSLTVTRINALEAINFVWDSHELHWGEKYDALVEYRNKNGHCSIPSCYKENNLGTWIKCQRRQYKLYCAGEPSSMTPERIQKLRDLDFTWQIRNRKPKNSIKK